MAIGRACEGLPRRYRRSPPAALPPPAVGSPETDRTHAGAVPRAAEDCPGATQAEPAAAQRTAPAPCETCGPDVRANSCQSTESERSGPVYRVIFRGTFASTDRSEV